MNIDLASLGDNITHNHESYNLIEAQEPVRQINLGSVPRSRRRNMTQTSTQHNALRGQLNRFMGRIDRLRQYLSARVCPSLTQVPAPIFIAVVCIMLLVLLVLVFFTLILLRRERVEYPLKEFEPDIIQKRQSSNLSSSIDEFGIFNISALPETMKSCEDLGFMCFNNPDEVISINQRCDGIAQCEDGSDEVGCTQCRTPLNCRKNTTNDGNIVISCLRGKQLCDGEQDCAYGEDEEFYCRSICKTNEIICGDEPRNKCLPVEYVCDGHDDCRNGRDEVNCKGVCVSGSRWCKEKQKCIPISKICDGIDDCADLSDELNCNCSLCSGSGKVLCHKSGRCITRRRICDGIVDCLNADDEVACSGRCSNMTGCWIHLDETPTKNCEGSMKNCKRNCKETQKDSTRNPECSPKSTCEHGYADCTDGFNGENCTRCKSGAIFCNGKCLPPEKRCNGIEDCPDKVDELDCTCEECHMQENTMYYCANSKRCYAMDTICLTESCTNSSIDDRAFCAQRLSYL